MLLLCLLCFGTFCAARSTTVSPREADDRVSQPIVRLVDAEEEAQVRRVRPLTGEDLAHPAQLKSEGLLDEDLAVEQPSNSRSWQIDGQDFVGAEQQSRERFLTGWRDEHPRSAHQLQRFSRSRAEDEEPLLSVDRQRGANSIAAVIPVICDANQSSTVWVCTAAARIGTPPVSYRLRLDTSQQNIYLLSASTCDETRQCYNATASSSSIPTNKRDAALSTKRCDPYRDVVQFPPLDPIDSVSFCVTKDYRDLAEDFGDADGLWGLSTYDLVSSFVMHFPSRWSHTYAIDINPPGQSSELQLGGYNDPYVRESGFRAPIIWSESSIAWSKSPMHSNSFMMFYLEFCGAPVFLDNYATGLVVVSLQQSALLLPHAYFDVVLTWLGTGCLAHSNHIFCDTRTWAPEREWDVDALPAFTFRLSHTSEWLSIPLKSLLVDDKPSDPHKVFAIAVSPAYSTAFIGTIPLSALYAVFDPISRRVGLASKFPVLTRATVYAPMCAPRKDCDALNLRTNECIQPDCSPFLFREYNPVTSSCDITFAAKLGFFFSFLLLAFFEIFTFKLYKYLADNVRTVLSHRSTD